MNSILDFIRAAATWVSIGTAIGICIHKKSENTDE